MGSIGPVASICATPASRQMDGRMDRCWMLGYVMSFADKQVSKAKNLQFQISYKKFPNSEYLNLISKPLVIIQLIHNVLCLDNYLWKENIHFQNISMFDIKHIVYLSVPFG